MSTPLQTTVFALLALLPAARSVAQATPAPADAPAAAAVTVTPAPTAAAPAATTGAVIKTEDGAAAQGVATKSKDAAGRDTLSVDFPDMDIREILRNVADLFELNIIIPESLQGKTTIKLRDVTWRQIFQSVLDPVGYTFTEEGNIIKIITKESVNDEPTSTEVFLVNYAKASDIAPIVTSLIDPAKGKMVVDVRTNSLVITERPTRFSRIRPIIEQLDRATDQVMIESKFVEVTDSDVKNIGVNWSSLAAYQIRAGNFSGGVDRTRSQTGTDGYTSNNGSNGTSSTRRTTPRRTRAAPVKPMLRTPARRLRRPMGRPPQVRRRAPRAQSRRTMARRRPTESRTPFPIRSPMPSAC
jgi:type II secretory pathway component HofQ